MKVLGDMIRILSWLVIIIGFASMADGLQLGDGSSTGGYSLNYLVIGSILVALGWLGDGLGKKLSRKESHEANYASSATQGAKKKRPLWVLPVAAVTVFLLIGLEEASVVSEREAASGTRVPGEPPVSTDSVSSNSVTASSAAEPDSNREQLHRRAQTDMTVATRFSRLTGMPVESVKANTVILDGFAGWEARYFEANCGNERFDATERAWAGTARAQLGLAWTLESLKGFVDSFESKTVTEIFAKQYGPSVGYGLLQEVTRETVGEITSGGCHTEKSLALARSLEKYMKRRIRDYASGFGGKRFRPSQTIPCPTFEVECFARFALRQSEQALGNEESANRLQLSNWVGPSDIGRRGLFAWFRLIQSAGMADEALANISLSNVPKNERGGVAAQLCIAFQSTSHCETMGSYVESDYRPAQWHMVPYLLAGERAETAERILNQTDHAEVTKYLDDVIYHHSVHGNRKSARRWLENSAAVYEEGLARSLRTLGVDPRPSFIRALGEIKSYSHGIRAYSARYPGEADWVCQLFRDSVPTLEGVNVSEVSGLCGLWATEGSADSDDAREVMQVLRKGVFFQPNDSRKEREATREYVLSIVAQIFARAGNRPAYDATIEQLPAMRFVPSHRAEMYALGAQKFRDPALLKMARDLIQIIPARVEQGVADGLESIALAEAALGNISAAWETASRIRYFNQRMTTYYKIVEPIVGLPTPYY